MSSYIHKKQRIIDEFRYASGTIRLDKDTSNLFRDRQEKPSSKLDVRDFNEVIQVDTDNHWVEVEGMTTYEKLVDATLPKGVMPTTAMV